MKIELAPLPYAYTALEPKIGKQTLEIHHDKHHAKYVNVANQMIEGTEMEKDDCATIVVKAHKAGNQVIFLTPQCMCLCGNVVYPKWVEYSRHAHECTLTFTHTRALSDMHARTQTQALFNNAAQSWNHDFYWKCMKPAGGGEVCALLAADMLY